MKHRGRTVVLALGAAFLSCVTARSAEETVDPDAPVSFYKQIRPILQAKCTGCHQPAKAKGDYIMTDFAKLLEGGEEGHAVLPGDPE